MNGRLLLLNILLGAAVIGVGLKLNANYQADQAKRAAFLRRNASPADISAHAPAEGAKPLQAASYLQVAQQMLFSKDRNPNVIIEIEPVAAPPPPPPVPPFPAASGMMKFGSDVIVMLSDSGKQKGYRLGDSVGPFKLSAIKDEELTFEWNGQTFKKTLTELKKLTPATPLAEAKPGTVPVGAATSTPTSVTVIGVNGQPVTNNATPKDKYVDSIKPPSGPGVLAGYGRDRGCDPNDKSPGGTVQDGYRKMLIPTPLGNTCIWEPVR